MFQRGNVPTREVMPRQMLVFAAAKPLGSVSPFYRQVLDGARQKLKIGPEPPGSKLFECVLKILYIICSPNGIENVQVLYF
jgi:hypothetical protein